MTEDDKKLLKAYKSAREKFLGLSLESTRKSYYPQLQNQLEIARENERRLGLLIDNLPALISYVDSDERYMLVNREYENAYSLKQGQIVGKRVEEIIGEHGYLQVKHHIVSVLQGNLENFEISFVNMEGKQKWFEAVYVPDVDPKAEVIGFYVLSLDITEKKKAEEERAALEAKLVQSQKLKSLGTLAGGIAHDFNNLLMGLQGRLSLMSVDLESDPGHPHHEHIRAMEEYIKSASNLTGQILGFARGGKYEVRAVNLNEIVVGSATMFARTRKEISIHDDTCAEPVIVDADRRQLEQVLINLYVNAWHAMPGGGDIYLRSEIVSLESEDCRAHDIKPGLYARVSVTDTGTGMSESVRLQIFDPFFTTKEKGRGTGLGLASAYGIARNHGGVITAYSEEGKGSTFNIYLPLSECMKPSEEFRPEEKVISGTGTILLVDDEEMIMDVGMALLQRLGYKVITSGDGEDAIDKISVMGDEIDLVILDLVMPDMDGGKVFDAIRKIRPKMPVLLSSGYAINGQADRIMKRGCDGFIQKPFTIAELSQHVGRIISLDRKKD